MSQQVEKLKKKAAEFEAKRQVDKAIATYLELFRTWDGGDNSGFDVTLYNRVGDMLIRAGNVGDAMSVWEKAVDYYGDGGFHNNAIALCNKILRHSPGRTSIYYKLGKISAQKGFKGDAKKNYLEYADRMQKANNINEAFRALKEFADLCPDDSDIRQMLADQLAKLGRNEEALEQLQLLYERYESTGETDAAAATVERMRSIDPAVEPKRSGPAGKRASSGLVFLDLDAPPVRTAPRRPSVAVPKPPALPAKRDHNSAIEGLPLIDMSEPTPPPARRKSMPVPPVVVEPPVVDAIVPEPVIETIAPDPVIETIVPEPVIETIVPEPMIDLIAPEPVVEPEPVVLEPAFPESIVVEPTTMEPVVLEPLVAEAIQIDEEPFEELPSILPVEVVDETPAEPEPATARADALELINMDDDAAEAVADDAIEVPAVPVEEPPAPPVMADVTFGASFGTDEGNARVSAPLGEIEATTFDENFGVEGAVSAALSSPEDVTFGTTDADSSGLPESSVPEMIEFMPGLDLGAPTELPDLVLDEAFSLSDDVTAQPPAVEPPAEPVPAPRAAPRRTVRPTMSILAQSVDLLRERVRIKPSDWNLHRQLGEALLEDGDRAGGLEQLEASMVGFERDDDLESARSVADEIIRLNPMSVRHHQRRVEYAFRMSDRPRLIEAYIELADALFREGQAEKSRVVYERVLELAPDDARALAALTAFVDKPRRASGSFTPPDAPTRASRRSVAQALADTPSGARRMSPPGMRRPSRAAAAVPDEPAPEVVSNVKAEPDQESAAQPVISSAADTAGAPKLEAAKPLAGDASTDPGAELALDEALDAAFDAAPAAPRPSQPLPETPRPATPATPRASQAIKPRLTPPSVIRASTDSEFVDLEDWLKEDERPKSTRMIVEEKPPTGDEAADFNDMLRKFKQGVARNVEDEDHESHYDLGIAYKEMGLVEEAIAEFQKALRGPKNRVRTYEALGQCFVEKGQEQVAMTILQRALAEPGAGDEQLIGVLYLLGISAEAVKQPAEAVKYYQRVFAVDINFRDVRKRMREIEQAGR